MVVGSTTVEGMVWYMYIHHTIIMIIVKNGLVSI